MALKTIGALWLKTHEDGMKFFSGTINNGILTEKKWRRINRYTCRGCGKSRSSFK